MRLVRCHMSVCVTASRLSAAPLGCGTEVMPRSRRWGRGALADADGATGELTDVGVQPPAYGSACPRRRTTLPCVHIDRLRIINFRNLADIDLCLLPGTVIVGENRVGKSNLLHAIRLVLDPALANSDRRLRREDFWDGLSDGTDSWDPMASRESIEIAIEISGFEHEPAVVTALSDALTAGDPMRAKLTYRWEPKDGDESGTAYRWIILVATTRQAASAMSSANIF